MAGRSAHRRDDLGSGALVSRQDHAQHLDPLLLGDKPYTWSGGFALVAPKGSSLSRNIWEFLKFYAGIEGQSIFMPGTSSLPTHREAFNLPDLAQLKPQMDQLAYSTSRPPVPIGQIWWYSLVQAQSSVTVGSRTPQEALEVAQARVRPQMETYCPFKLPEGYGKTGF